MFSVKGCFSVRHSLVMFGASEAHPSLQSLVSAQRCPPYTPAWMVDSSPTDIIISDVTLHCFGDSYLCALSVTTQVLSCVAISSGRERCPILDPIAWPLSSHTGALVVFSDPCRPQALLWAMS